MIHKEYSTAVLNVNESETHSCLQYSLEAKVKTNNSKVKH